MKKAFWAWCAVSLDLWVFLGPLPLFTTSGALAQVWLVHAAACAVLATSGYLLMPPHYRGTSGWSWLLIFNFALIAPVVGPIALLVITHTSLNRTFGGQIQAKPRSVTLPEYDVRATDTHRAGQGAIRSRLTTQVPANVRMQSLLTLQAVPGRVANPILEDLLGDATDDVRLIAFGMLDAEEKKLSVHIHREQKNLERELPDAARYDCLRHLAELHWELVYAGLAQGGLKKHNLVQARKYLNAALAMHEPHACGILFLKGRVLLAQGEIGPAEVALEEALRLGQAEASVLPYLAELAFQRRQFHTTHAYMQRLKDLHVASRTMAIVDIWTGRDNARHFLDRRILHHI